MVDPTPHITSGQHCEHMALEEDITKDLLAELGLLVLGQYLVEAFLKYGEECNVVEILPHPIPKFCFNVVGSFVGTIKGPLPCENGNVLNYSCFIATQFLPSNPAKGDTGFIKITGHDPLKDDQANTLLEKTLHAFAHFGFLDTKCTHILCDLQG
ncbi:hypothetical protein BS47DRAFT_1402396 [Hydnum rufescens UP504]|uniref:Alpha-type protein kinase domain-containing protein n=1 Tax=Hydnum rufescens UP504 TaxID=1448309 RepID=A0A9P6AEH6_9AGAM|nr:hypothetical protein BS47DRAFT_1402396 [Hydnum rufescens UP504]